MAYGTIFYARYHDRSKVVDWVRRTELRVCNNKIEQIFKINNYKSKHSPHIRVTDDNLSCFLHDYESGMSVLINFESGE